MMITENSKIFCQELYVAQGGGSDDYLCYDVFHVIDPLFSINIYHGGGCRVLPILNLGEAKYYIEQIFEWQRRTQQDDDDQIIKLNLLKRQVLTKPNACCQRKYQLSNSWKSVRKADRRKYINVTQSFFRIKMLSQFQQPAFFISIQAHIMLCRQYLHILQYIYTYVGIYI